MAAPQNTAVISNWEDFLADDITDASPSQEKTNLVVDTAKPMSEAVAKKLQQKKIEEDFANEAFDFLLPSKAMSGENEKKKKATKGKMTEKPKLSESQMWQLLDVSNFQKSENVALILASKLAATKMKSAAYYRFIDILLQECRTKMEKSDLEALKTKLISHIRSSALALTTTKANKRKPNEQWNMTHFKEEMDIVYGGDEENETDMDEEDYDAYEDTGVDDGDAF